MSLNVFQDMRALRKLCFMLLVTQASWLRVVGQDWADYDDAPGPMAPGPMRMPSYGLAYRPMRVGPTPYGPVFSNLASPPPPATTSKSPPPPPPTTVVITQGYSTSTTVPAIKSTASLTNYATVAAFNTSERARFVTTLEASILKLLDVLANVTVDSVVAGSVTVDDTISFSGADSTAATEARDALVTALSSGDTSIFGTTFGTVTVSSVSSTNSTNTATKSGAGSMAIGYTSVVMAAATMVVLLYFSF